MSWKEHARRLPKWVRSPAARMIRGSRLLTRLMLEPRYLAEEYPAWLRREPIPPRPAVTGGGPRLSLVMPVYQTPEDSLRAAIASVRAQDWPEWELCIADDASPSAHVRRVLEEAASREPRIRLVFRETNGHIAEASNSALALATGEWVALMDHDDLLPPHALSAIVAAIQASPQARLIFSDEDKVETDGTRFDPYFKPGFDPDLFLGQNLISHLGVYRRDLLERIGGWRKGYEGSQDYDLALRAVAAAGPDAVRHVPGVLYHWRQAKGGASFSQTELDRCAAAARRAVADFLAARGEGEARVEPAPRTPYWNRVRWPIAPDRPAVSLVVLPERDASASLAAARRLAAGTRYPLREILVAARKPMPAAPVAEGPETVILSCGGAGWAGRVNRAVEAARGTIVVLAGDRPGLVDPDWLEELVAQLGRPGIGAAGSLVLNGAGKLRQAEVALDETGPHPAYAGAWADAVGYLGALVLVRRVGALPGSHMAFRRETFLAAGGADEAELDGAMADLDLCLKLRARGLGLVWTPHAALVEAGGAPAADPRALDAARLVLEARWGAAWRHDPARSPLLALSGGLPVLRRAAGPEARAAA
jgi:GT2 family glycosyltransferase